MQIWYMNGSSFQKFPKFEPKLAQIWENLGKIWRFCQKFGKKLSRLVCEWVTLSWKLVFVWVYFQIPLRHIPTKTKLEYLLGCYYPVFLSFSYFFSSYLCVCVCIQILLSYSPVLARWITNKNYLSSCCALPKVKVNSCILVDLAALSKYLKVHLTCKKVLPLVEPWGVRMQWEHTTLISMKYSSFKD